MGKEMTFEETKEFCEQVIELWRQYITYSAVQHIMLVIQGADLTLGEKIRLMKKLRHDPKEIDPRAADYLDEQITTLEKLSPTFADSLRRS